MAEKAFRDVKVGDPLYIFDCSKMELTTYIFKGACGLGFCSDLAISLDKSALMEIVEAQKSSKERQISKLTGIIEQLNKE